MTKLTQSMVEAAATAMGNGFIDEDGSRSISLRDVNAIWALINSAREQLGQQAAAPPVEKMREVLRKIAGGFIDAKAGATDMILAGNWKGFCEELQKIARDGLKEIENG